MFAKNKYSLLFHYLFVGPLYYVIAMAAAILILAWMKDWSFIAAKNAFFVASISMWLMSYFIHYKVLLNAISDIRNDRR